MKMIREESPGIAGSFCSLEIGGKPLQEIIAVIITEEDFAPVNPTTDDVVEGSRDINS